MGLIGTLGQLLSTSNKRVQGRPAAESNQLAVVGVFKVLIIAFLENHECSERRNQIIALSSSLYILHHLAAVPSR